MERKGKNKVKTAKQEQIWYQSLQIIIKKGIGNKPALTPKKNDRVNARLEI